jgi:hypothetical protein
MNAQHLVLKVCMQLASSSALLCFGIRQYAPHAITRIQFHAFNFHASCVHVILVRGNNCTKSCASIVLVVEPGLASCACIQALIESA